MRRKSKNFGSLPDIFHSVLRNSSPNIKSFLRRTVGGGCVLLTWQTLGLGVKAPQLAQKFDAEMQAHPLSIDNVKEQVSQEVDSNISFGGSGSREMLPPAGRRYAETETLRSTRWMPIRSQNDDCG